MAAHLAAVTLGLVAALLGVLVGPAMKLLLSPGLEFLSWQEIFGGGWSYLLSGILPGAGVQASVIYFWLPFVLVGVAAAKSSLTFWQWFTWESLGEHLAYRWRQSLVDAFIVVDPGARDDGQIQDTERQLGGLMSQDIRTCRDYVVHFFGGLPREGAQVLFMSISLVLLSPKLFVLFFFCLAPLVILLSRLGKKIRRRASAALEDNSFVGEWIQQRLLGLETIKQFGTETSEIQAMQRLSEDLFTRFFRAARLKARTAPFVELVGIASMAFVLSMAFDDIANGELSGSVAMSFFTTLALLAQSATKLSRYFNSNREGRAAADRIFTATERLEIFTRKTINSVVFNAESSQTYLQLTDVSVHYNQTIALKNFSYRFQGGKVYCLLGPSGAGKSTVFNAILGLRPLASGAIQGAISDGFAYRTLDIAYLPQQMSIISARLGEIVSYPFKDYDPVRVSESLHVVKFELSADRLVDGLQSMVGPGGLQLSGGQWQRLQLARLHYHLAPVVLVDEGTSALDPEIERVVLDFVRDLAKRGAIVLMIAHRQSAMMACDEWILLKNGSIGASGPKDEMMKSRFYQEMIHPHA